MAHHPSFDFDKVIDRTNTHSLKFDFAEQRGYPFDVLPLWVADMDFPTTPPVIDALVEAAQFGIFGYSEVDETYNDEVVRWFECHFQWDPSPLWLVKTPGVVYALAMAVQAFTEPGESVLIQPPVYYPFFGVVKDNGRKLVENQLVYHDGTYSIDFDDFEQKIVDNDVKLFCLCSPHNPVGRVWRLEELKELGRICKRHGVLVVSDEIHCDFIWPGSEHHVFCEAVPEMTDSSIICTAPSKTFNLAGLQASHIFIPNQKLRHKFKNAIKRSGYSQLNTMGLVAAKAAYEKGEPWLDACKDYLYANLRYVDDYLKEHLPELEMVRPEGTYFAWIDCSKLGLSSEELDELIVHKAKLWLDAGHIFGTSADQFQRIVVACPRARLTEALDRLRDAVNALGATGAEDAESAPDSPPRPETKR